MAYISLDPDIRSCCEVFRSKGFVAFRLQSVGHVRRSVLDALLVVAGLLKLKELKLKELMLKVFLCANSRLNESPRVIEIRRSLRGKSNDLETSIDEGQSVRGRDLAQAPPCGSVNFANLEYRESTQPPLLHFLHIEKHSSPKCKRHTWHPKVIRM